MASTVTPIPYKLYNDKKKSAQMNLEETMNNNPIPKLDSYDAIKIETERLLNREQTFFMINTFVTFGLLITLFKVL